MLTIQQLADGNYKIELTICDSHGEVIFSFGGIFQRVESDAEVVPDFNIQIKLPEA